MRMKWKRVLSLLLCFTLCMSNMNGVVAKNTTSSEDSWGISDEELKVALAADVGIYPQGGFEFFTSQVEGKEGDKSLEIWVVRRGGVEEDATVDFKAVDVSTKYGEDYTLSVQESKAIKNVLSTDGELKSLAEMYADGSIEAYQQEGASAENSTVDRSTESKESAESVSTGAITADTTANRSSLRRAKESATGEASEKFDWKEAADAKEAEAAAVTEESRSEIEEFAEKVDGVSTTIKFAAGEYRKKVMVDIIDDTVSETDEQALFLLSNPQNAELSDGYNAYLNVKDDDGDEKVIFAMKDAELTANRSDGKVAITIERVSGEEKFASVNVGTAAMDANPDVDYVPVQTEVVFPQGIKEQTIEVELINGIDLLEGAQFKVGLDFEEAFVKEGENQTIVTLKNSTNDEVKAMATESKEEFMAQVNAVEENTEVICSDELETITTEATDGSKTVTYNVSGFAKAYGTVNGWSGRQTYLSGIDLSLADYVRIHWVSNEGSRTTSYTYKDGCDTKTGYTTHYDRQAYLFVNDEQLSSYGGSGFGWQWTGRINLSESMKKESSYLQVESRPVNNNNYAIARVAYVEVHYPGYTFTVENAVSDNNTYTPKIYSTDGNKTDSAGRRYTEGTTLNIGQVNVAAGGSTSYGASVRVHTKVDNLSFLSTYYPNTNSNGVSIRTGNTGNTFLAGYQLMSKNSSTSWSPTIKPSDFVFNRSFVNNYSSYLYDGNVFRIRPIYQVYDANVKFLNSETNKGSYANGITNDSILQCKQLDVIKLTGIANTGFSVDGFSLGEIRATSLHNAFSESNNNIQLVSTEATNYIKVLNSMATSAYSKDSVANAKSDKAIRNVITFSPSAEYVYTNMAYSTPAIDVKIDPKNNDKTQGSVVFTDPVTGVVSEGNYLNPLKIEGITLNNVYSLIGVTNEGYKTYWKDFTGDVAPEDGTITTAEEGVLKSYSIDHRVSNGNAFSYKPVLPNSLVYYGFQPVTQNRYEGTIDGVVSIVERPIFGTESTEVPVNGAVIAASGETTTTKEDEYGGLDGRGGAGFFALKSREFGSNETHMVNVTYENLTVSATQAVNAAAFYKIDAYDTIGVTSAEIYSITGTKATKITANDLVNGDKNYRFVIQTKSDNDALIATKAEFGFYRKDGSIIKIETVDNGTTSNGIFTYNFNPKALGIPTGSTMTIRFYDQNKTAYFEHEAGVMFAQSLGLLSFLSSFNFGGAEKAIQVIGKIDSAFDFGWDIDVDDVSSKNVSVSNEGDEKTLSIGFAFNYEKESADEDETDKADTKKAAKDGTEAEKKKAVNDATDKNATKKTSAKVSASVGFDLSFSLGITMVKETIDLNKRGEWYFKEMMLVAKAGVGVEVAVTFMTPIGVPVIITCKTTVDGQAILVIEQGYDKSKKYYFSDVLDTSAGKIDLFNFGASDPNRVYDAYGEFSLDPVVDISAGVGISCFNVSIGGVATFDFDFYTKADKQNTGTVVFSAYVKLKLLFFEKKFNLGSTSKISLFNTNALSLMSDGTYLDESLDTFEVSDREYLKNRTAWNGEKSISAQSVSSTSGVKESTLMEGVNPYPDAEMVALTDGDYLAIFVDDVPGRTASNSTAIYYSIYDAGTSSWSIPLIIEEDGTVDDSPSVYDMGSKGIYVAWSSADKTFGTDPGVLDTLNSRNIRGGFFDKTSRTFSAIKEVTKTTELDFASDVDPKISYVQYKEDGLTKDSMIVYYTKSEYYAEDDLGNPIPAKVGDVLYSASMISYRMYDFTKNQWVDSFDPSVLSNLTAGYNYGYALSEQITEQQYEEGFYGQQFLQVTPEYKMTETLDENGYWTAEPTFEARTKTGLETVMESDVISYNGMALYAYVLDYDGNQETTADRDIFMQLYDHELGYFSHPITITNDKVEDGNIRFARAMVDTSGDGTTLLTYLSDGDIKTLDVSKPIRFSEGLRKTTVGSQEVYYLNKEVPSVESSETAYVYEPMQTIVNGGKVVDEAEATATAVEEETDDETITVTEEVKAEEDLGVITGFDIASSKDYVYALWTERKTVLAEGVEEGTEEAIDPANRKTETQIYTTRYDLSNGIVTKPVQVTDEEGMNYDDIAFCVDDGEVGKITAIAAKAGNVMVTDSTENGEDISYNTEDINNRKLIRLEFTPVSTLTMTNAFVTELTSGTDSPASISFYNDGLETYKDCDVIITDESGKEVLKQKLGYPIYDDEGINVLSNDLYGGRNITLGFPITLTENQNKCELNVVVKDGEKIILSEQYMETIPEKLDIENVEAKLLSRGTLQISAEVVNNGRTPSVAQSMKVEVKTLEVKKEFLTIDVPALAIGASTNVVVTKDYQYSDIFETYISEDAGYEAQAEFRLSTVSGGYGTDTITLYATQEQVNRMNAIKDIVIGGKKDYTYAIGVGGLDVLSASVEGVGFTSARYEEDETSTIAPGLKVRWMVEDESIVKLYDSGYIEGLRPGTTTATAYVMPDNNVIKVSGDNVLVEDNFTKLPEEAIQTKKVTITVSDGTKAQETPTPTAAPTAAPIVTPTSPTVTLPMATPSPTERPSIKLNKSKLTLGLGESFTVKPSVKGDSKLKKITYKASKKAIVSIGKTKSNGSAVIKAKKLGKTNITVKTANGLKSVLKITVKKAPTKVTVKKSSVTLKKGKKTTLKYSLSKGAASNLVAFNSSNKKIATVSTLGVVMGRKKGKVVITLQTYNKKKVKVKVTVK